MTSTRALSGLRFRGRNRVFYGWWIVAVGAGLQFLGSAVMGQAYGAYVVFLREDFGWSKTALAAASSMREAESGITGPFQGWLLDRFGPRAVARAGVVLLSLGLMAFSQVNSLLTFYAAFLVIALGLSFSGYLTTTYTFVQWFERRRSTAISLGSSGFALGGMAVPILVLCLDAFGWRTTAFASGVLVLAVGLVLTQFLHHRPSVMGLQPDGDETGADGLPRRAARDPRLDFTLGEALRAPAFWWISLGHASALFVVSAMSVHLFADLTESQGYSKQAAAFIVFLLTALFLFATISGGLLGDRFNKRVLVVCCMAMHAVGLLLLSHATNHAMVLAFVLLHGLAWGWRGPQMAALRADYFGPTSFGKILGVSNMVIILGTISGPIIAGYVYDQTGSYQVGFDILACIAALGSVFFILAARPAPPPRVQALR